MMRCRAVTGDEVSPKLVLCPNVNTPHGHGEHAALLRSTRQLYSGLSGAGKGPPPLSLELPFAA